VAKDRTTVQAPDPGIGTPPRDSGRSLDVLHTELAKIQVDGDYTKSFLSELKVDMRDMRDRMAKLEVRVDHLPSKGFIVGVVMLALTLIGGLLTVAPKLQMWAGTAAQSSGTTHSP
jgi:hypothetical protein